MSAQTLAEVLRKAIDSRLDNTHTALPGKVVTYNPALMVVDVEPVVQRVIPDDDGIPVYEDLPILQNVPVAFPRSGQNAITWPITPGDTVLVIFLEDDASNWRDTGQKAPPAYQRKHGLHSAVALPCLQATPEVLPAAALPNMVITSAGDLLLGDLTATMYVALAPLVSAALNSVVTAFNAHTHQYNPGPGALVPTAVPAVSMGTFTATDVGAVKTKAL